MNLHEFAHECISAIRFNINVARRGGGPEDYLVPYGSSAPGIGKTAITAAIAEGLGNEGADVFAGGDETARWTRMIFELRTENPIDFAGMPKLGENKSGLLRPQWMPDTGMKIIVLDELPQASPAILNNAATLIQRQTVGPHALPPGCMIIGLGNPPETVTGTRPLPEHTINRMLFYTVTAEFETWKPTAIAAGIDPLILAYLSRFPDHLHVPARNNQPQPSPRSWIMASNALTMPMPPLGRRNTTTEEQDKHEKSMRRQRLEAAIGSDMATNLMAHADLIGRLPSLSKILTSPETAPMPDRIEDICAICGALAQNLAKSPKHFDPIITWARRLDSEEWPPILIAAAVSRHPQLKLSPTYIAWQAKIGSLLSGTGGIANAA